MPATKTKPISISALIQSVIDEYPSSDRSEAFVAAVMEKIPREDYEHYLKQTLLRVVLMVDAQSRRSSISRLTSSHRMPVGSPKRELLKTRYWPEFLRQSIPTDHGRVQLGLASPQDLAYAAQIRVAHATASLEEADKYQRLSDLMAREHAQKLSDLDFSIVEEVWLS